ncbi:MAG: TetR/AcrR family transcriptional regulator [Chloroflexota bacterium]
MTRKNGRDEIVRVARELFYTKGYETTSVSNILDAAGMSRGAFYHHFESKQTLLVAIIDVIAAELNTAVDVAMQDDSLTAVERYQQLVYAVNAYQETDGVVMSRIWLATQDEQNLRLMHYLRQTVFQSFGPKLASILKQGVGEGEFDIDLVDDAAEMLLGICEFTINGVAHIVFNQEQYDDPVKRIVQKVQMGQTAVDRLVGAPLGELLFFDKREISELNETHLRLEQT